MKTDAGSATARHRSRKRVRGFFPIVWPVFWQRFWRWLGLFDRPATPETPSPKATDRLSTGRSGQRHLRALSTVTRTARAGRKVITQIIGPATNLRVLLVWGFLTMAMLLLLGRLFYLQVLESADLTKKAKQQQAVYLTPYTPRRPIVDRQGNVVAIDQPVYQLFAHPKLFTVPQLEVAQKLSGLLGRSPEALLNRFSEAESGIRLEFALQENTADQVRRLSLDGLELLQRRQRIYPQQSLFSEVVGYVNEEGRGQAGLEFSQQNLLFQAPQTLAMKRVDTGALVPEQLPESLLRRDDIQLRLTIDNRLQRIARQSLLRQLQRYNAKRGTVIVMDARDGSLLTLLSEPSYDPNQYYKANIELFKNWAVTDLYEPGSTFKPINVAIALEAQVIQPNTTLYSEGQITVGGWPIQDFDYSSVGARGAMSVTESLKYSSNVAMVNMIRLLKRADYYQWLRRFNLGSKSGIDLPFEVASQLKPREQFINVPVEAATASFGQGFSLTPIQLVQLHGILANGGLLVTPHVVDGLFSTDGQPYWQPHQQAERRVIAKQTAQTVVQMMEAVVESGTGKAAQIKRYRVAGKTGTAQKANPNGGYLANAKITSFVAIFPAEAPRYVIATIVDEPQGDDAFGSTVAAPVVKAVIESLIVIEGLAPNRPPAAATPSPS